MRADFVHFGDVMCFYTTYQKNKDGRPFALFVGVNNHMQTIIFGAALLYDETTDTFMWLLNTFSRAMFGKKPKTILTDQDASMAKALALSGVKYIIVYVYGTFTRMLRLTLATSFQALPNFQRTSGLVFMIMTRRTNLAAWKSMLEKYVLQNNNWLKRLFDIKEKWALVYGRRAFCGGMTTTQHSERMNNALKKYVSYKHNMLQSFEHFQQLVDHCRFQEDKADLQSSQSTPDLSFLVAILMHAVSIYTNEVFNLFQDELSKAHDSTMELCSVTDAMSEYNATPYQKHRHHKVTYNASTSEVLCSCKTFEFAGILCLHALKILAFRNIDRISEAYISKRWTMKAKKCTHYLASDFTLRFIIWILPMILGITDVAFYIFWNLKAICIDLVVVRINL